MKIKKNQDETLKAIKKCVVRGCCPGRDSIVRKRSGAGNLGPGQEARRHVACGASAPAAFIFPLVKEAGRTQHKRNSLDPFSLENSMLLC